jgi:hypothetical protein
MARAALVVALLAVPLLAQRHGASGGFAGHSGPASGRAFAGHFTGMSHGSIGHGSIGRGSMGHGSMSHGSMSHGSMIHRGSGFSAGTHFHGNGFAGRRHPSFASSRRFSRFNRGRFFYGVSPWLSYGYPGYYSSPYPYYDDFDYSQQNSEPDYNDSGGYDDPSGQMAQDQINHLEGEVAELREQRNSARPSSQAKAEIRASTVLIFRDRRAQEVQNYAIVGDTLWIFDAQKSTKIAVDSLDIPASTKANEDRGIDFRLPEPQ